MQFTKAQALAAYRMMQMIRVFELSIYQDCLKGFIPGFNHLYAGEEACAVGVVLALRVSDWITSSHRAHGHYLAKTDDLRGIAFELYGRKAGACGGKGGSMHVTNLKMRMFGANGIVGASVPHAVGLAWAAKMQRRNEVAAAFFGDGAFNQGGTLEAMNLASVYGLPVVFVLEDNGYAESTASRWSIAGNDAVGRAAGFGIPGSKVDGTDLSAVYAAAELAVKRARSGGGPSFIHVELPMFYGHYVGDPERYRAKGEAKRDRKERDCISKFRLSASRAGILDIGECELIDAQVAAEVAAVITAAKSAPSPGPADLLRDVYVSY